MEERAGERRAKIRATGPRYLSPVLLKHTWNEIWLI
jgi:hypothetical protein